MTESSTTPGEPMITFIANHVPPLQDGTYTLTLTQTLTGTLPNNTPLSETFSKTVTFAVCGERFALNPNHIHKVFPPPNTQGNYDNVLPHVVLSRRTLPWDRSPSQASQAPKSPLSWLALLVFAAEEAPDVNTGTLADLYPSTTSEANGTLPSGVYSYGSATENPTAQAGPPTTHTFLQCGEKSTDPCVWFDLDPYTFAAYAPSLADLQWNAHARQRTHADGTSDDFAVVVGSRLPPAGTAVVAHLVSLEGLGDHLPASDGTRAALFTSKAIRLVSLKSWKFLVRPLEASFSAVLTGLNGSGKGDSQLRLPNTYRPSAAPTTPRTPSAPFDAGYTVLAAGRSAAGRSPPGAPVWYRGPFVPSITTPSTTDPSWSKRLPADDATSLDVAVLTTPSVDRSYSAAWQIGRLIALADTDFATAQIAWKRDCRLALNAAIGRSGSVPRPSRAEYAQKIRNVLADPSQIRSLLGSALAASPTPAPAGVGEADQAPASGASTQTLSIPQTLVDWLGKLALLTSVPFPYLVPDAGMLPPESLRFFNVDPRWIACLLDGAWSLGREPRAGWAFDVAYQPWSQLQTGTLRPSTCPSTAGVAKCWPVSGAVLNSRLVPAYGPAIDFLVSTGVNVLREVRLGPNTMLLLFDGQSSTLKIREPFEGVHFGFDVASSGVVSKPLRSLSTGAPLSGIPPISVPQRSSGVIQLDRLAKSMMAKLGTAPITPFTAAELALELVKGVSSVEFKVPKGSTKGGAS